MTTERYIILKKLGEGGSGRTYLVRDRKLGKLWAMKEWKPENGAAGSGMGAGGEEEFRILRSLDSPCFPRLVERFWEDGRQYLVMDWVRGMTLEEKLGKDGPLGWREAAGCALQLCGALEKLHEGKPAVLHLDLKPSNIILTQDGPRLIDFGSAVLVYAQESTDEENRLPAAEKSSRTGTPGFAAPELLLGQDVDAGSDVYGLGAVLQVMLTGKKPQEKRRKPEGVPAGLWEIAEQAMRGEKKDRFRDAREMKHALEDFLKNGEKTDEKTRLGKTEKRMRRGTILAILAAIGMGICFSPAGNDKDGAAFFPEGRGAGKEAVCSGKRIKARFQSPIWELAQQEKEKGRLLGIRHDLGEAVRKAAEQDRDAR